MFNQFIRGAIVAIGMTLAASSSMAASLGLSTSGPIDTGAGDFDSTGFGTFFGFPIMAIGGPSNFFHDIVDPTFSSFDSGGDIASVLAYGFTGGNGVNNVLEFELSAFDGYTNGALLIVSLTDTTNYGGDPLASISGTASVYSVPADYSLQSIAAVPLPMGVLLLGTALAGLGVFHSRGKLHSRQRLKRAQSLSA